jgi:hypothetical protein
MSSFNTLGYQIELVDLAGIKQLQRQFEQLQDTYSEQHISQRAQEDAQHDIPAIDHRGLSSFEQELVHTTAELASKVAITYRGSLEMLDAKIKAERTHLEQQQADELERVDSMYKVDQDAAENAFPLKDAHKQLELAEQHYATFYARYGRAPIVYIPHWLYWIFAFAIFAGEVPLNAMVFQIFGESQIMTWVMAIIIGLSIPLTAHFVGIKLREHPDGFSISNAIKALVAFGVAVVALYELSILRQSYLGENREPLGLTAQLVADSFLFFYLNLAVLCTAILIAYLSHDSAPGFEQAEAELVAARKKVAKLERQRVDLLKQAAVQRAEEKRRIHEQYRDGCNRVALMHGTYDQLLKEGQEFERRCVSVLRKLVSIYRRENVRARSDKRAPACFETTPDLDLELRTIAEKLNNDERMFTSPPEAAK